MDSTIGEALSHTCVKGITKAISRTHDMISLTTLEKWLLVNICDNGVAPDPTKRYFAFCRDADDNEQLRHDVVTNIGNYAPIVNDYYLKRDTAYRTFAGFGAKPVFLYYHPDKAVSESLLDQRYSITEKLETAVLGKRGTGHEIGIMLGGAIGKRRAYIDLLLYDEQAFIEKARTLLADLPITFYYKEFVHDGKEFTLSENNNPKAT
jgi:hypothetical protein